MKVRSFCYAAWGVLVFNLAVIVWGAYVRVSFSGDGCGTHWPSCQGHIVPVTASALAEFIHRTTSAVALMLIVALAVWAFFVFPRGHWARRGAAYSVGFIFSEALIGAGLVLFKWVTHNASVYRALALSLHLMNTFVLLGFLLATIWAAGSRFAEKSPRVNWHGQGVVGWVLAIGLVLMLIAGVCGSIASLGDMLFPSASLAAGLRADFNPLANFTVRWRWLHPVISIGAGVYLVWCGLYLMRLLRAEAVRQAAWTVIFLVGAQIALGVVNLLLMAPIPMQMGHLILADLLWLALVRLTLEAIHAHAAPKEVEWKAENSLNLVVGSR